MRKNLILVANPNGMDPSDFEEIAEIVRQDNKRLDAFVVRVDQRASVIADRFWRNPTLIVAFDQGTKAMVRASVYSPVGSAPVKPKPGRSHRITR